MAKPAKVRTASGTWVDLAPAVADLSNYSTTSQMNTSIDNAKGLVLISSQTITAQSTVNINNCFSATYDNYKIVFNVSAASSNLNIFWQYRASGSNLSSNLYFFGFHGIRPSGSTYLSNLNPGGSIYLCQVQNSAVADFCSFNLDIYHPFYTSRRTLMNGFYTNIDGTGWWSMQGGGNYDSATRADGFSIYSGGSATFSGELRIYGYRNS